MGITLGRVTWTAEEKGLRHVGIVPEESLVLLVLGAFDRAAGGEGLIVPAVIGELFLPAADKTVAMAEIHLQETCNFHGVGDEEVDTVQAWV